MIPININALAYFWAIPTTRIWQLLKSGELPSTATKHGVYIKCSDFDRWAEENKPRLNEWQKKHQEATRVKETSTNYFEPITAIRKLK